MSLCFRDQRCHPVFFLTVGSLWKVNGHVYRVETCWGDEPGFRFVLREVERDRSIDREIRAKAKARHRMQRRSVLVQLRRSVMTVDRPWFERKDVEHVGSGVPCPLCRGVATAREGIRCWECNEPSEMG